MNIFEWPGIGRYNKATAAAVSLALVQLAAAFVPFPPELEQAIGIVLTSVLVYFVPNKAPAVTRSNTMPANGAPLVAHSPAPIVIMALAVSLLLSGCAALGSADSVADRLLGADCGPESRVFRARALTEGLGRALPEIPLEGMNQSVAIMAKAAASGRPIDPGAAAFQGAMISAIAPLILSPGMEGEPIWLHLLKVPAVAAEIVQIRQQVAAFCVSA